MSDTIRILIACPDARGIVAAVAAFIAEHGGNLIDADQHSDTHQDEFFMRVAIEREGFKLDQDTFEAAWQPLAEKYNMDWRIYWGERKKRMVILVGKQGHCLADLLWRWQSKELNVDIPLVLSNHPTLAHMAGALGIPFECHPVLNGKKEMQEQELLRRLAAVEADFVVLARYMQILSEDFIAQYPMKIINIHHSFLPAFAGGSPYQKAYERGVKMIGATSHYVIPDLDAGPIIAQDTASTSHRDTVEDLVRKGSDLERVVLARAVHAHVEDRVLVSRNKTVVFD